MWRICIAFTRLLMYAILGMNVKFCKMQVVPLTHALRLPDSHRPSCCAFGNKNWFPFFTLSHSEWKQN
uniref:Putative secreted protein n=1 Tax=Anopheles darlingi TaxID=43151 RepID=A0A2M4DR85_ANODA